VKPTEQAELLAIMERSLPGTGAGAAANIRQLAGGGNNRLFKVELEGAALVIKRYFRHPSDPRNRLDSEYRFSEYLWRRGERSLPEPLARDDESGVGFYRFIEGSPLEPGLVAEREMYQALAFLDRANQWRRDAEAFVLPDASEACFTLQQHLDLVEKRVQRLLQLPAANAAKTVDRTDPTDPSDKTNTNTCAATAAAATLVQGRLLPAWKSVRRECLKRAAATDHPLEEPLSAADRILSPSDFGFHNALQTAGGLVFHDFEYAGWDDPAKTVCDFFCQVAVPAPLRYWEKISTGCAQLTGAPEKTLQRMQLLLPAYRIKWVCIALNGFLSVDGARRRFANQDAESHLAGQLILAEKLLSALNF
jgi:hypothetical protein